MSKIARFACVAMLACLFVIPAGAQDRQAPEITGMAVQGISVNLEYFKGDKNVLVVFYRLHN